MTTEFLASDIKGDEGCELTAYRDTLGIWTVGVGHAHVAADTVWTQEQCDEQLALDILGAETDLDRNIPWWRSLSDPRQDVVVNMAFNLGWSRLSGFHAALTAMRTGNYDAAADQMLDSKWARQLPKRSSRLAEQMRTGERA